MNYDAIILELMTRIKTLETRCEEIENEILLLKESIENADESANTETTDTSNPKENRGRKTKMTPEMVQACYEYGIKMSKQKDFDFNKEIEKLTAETGMNRNSAIMYVYAVKNMLAGTVYKRAISKPATEVYYQYILRDFGKDALQKAIRATRAHIEYLKKCGYSTGELGNLCDQYD